MMSPLRFALLSVCSLMLLAVAAVAQDTEGGLMTQVLVRADSKADVMPTAQSIKLEIESKPTPVVSLTPVKPSGVQVALLIDDGLSRSAGIQLNDLQQFVRTLPAGIELLVGYMRYGSVDVLMDFTTDHAAAAEKIRLPTGIPGESASPYLCLSDFVKKWPGMRTGEGAAKARLVMMITNGVDPYNGSDRLSNQDSPYVAAAALDAERAGVAVYSIYYRDSGFRGGQGSLSGQSYLQQVADSTGGVSFYQGSLNPVSLTPFFQQFVHSIAETYVATFNTNAQGGGKEHLVRVKMSTTDKGVKVRHPDEVRPGNLEMDAAGSAPGR